MDKGTKAIFAKLKEWGCAVEEARERLLGNDTLYVKFLHKVAEEEDFFHLEELLEKKGYKEAFELAHTQKGVVANLGLTPLYETLSSLVENLRAEDYTGLTELCSEVLEQHKKLKEIMHEE